MTNLNQKNNIDIVTLNYNNKGYIEPCIESIKENTFVSYNLFVIDQDSKDGSREWLQENVSNLILNKENVGAGEGFNQGIRAGKADWIVLLDSDVIIKDKEWFNKIWKYTIDEQVGFIETKIWGDLYQKHQYSGNSFCMFRRKCLTDIGLFDKKILFGGDLELFARLEWSGWKTAYCSDTDIFHYNHVTINKVFSEDEKIKILSARDEKLHFKYTEKFLEQSLYPHGWRRLKEERIAGWRK